MLSAAISAANTVALSGYKLDLSFLFNPFVFLLFGLLLFYYVIFIFIRLFT